RQTGVPVDPGKQDTLSAYLKSKDLSDVRSVYVAVINAGWSWHSGYLTPPAVTSDWTRCATTVTPAGSSDGKYSVVVCSAKGAAGTVWVDWVQLQEGSAPGVADIAAGKPR